MSNPIKPNHQKYSVKSYLLLFILSLSFLGCKPWSTPISFTHNFKSNVGDSIEWASTNYIDTHWAEILPDTNCLWWVRSEIEIDSSFQSIDNVGLAIYAIASYDLYWDGVLIGKNGVVGTDKFKELEGSFLKLYLIPDSLTNIGKHQVSMRLSNFHTEIIGYFYPYILGDYYQLSRNELVVTAFMYILAGIFLVISLYYFFYFFLNQSKITFLLFGLISFSFFSLIILEYLKFYIEYHYSTQFIRLKIILATTLLISSLLPIFFSYHFEVPIRKKITFILPSLLIVICFISTSYDLRTYVLSGISFIISILIILWAIYKKNKGSTLALIGISPSLLNVFYLYYDIILFVSFGNLIIFMMISLILQMRADRKKHEAYLLKSSRLEIELLKKNIQPHFIMNSLTAAMEWMEEKPEIGIKVIEALTKEFEILNQVSGEKLISINKELALCDSLLKIMSYRKDQNFSLKKENINNNELIPPAIIHTLVENGITHNTLQQKNIEFFLSFYEDNKQKKYHFFTPGNTEDYESNTVDGTGLKYVKARLEESFPGKWKILSEKSDKGWQTILSFETT